MEKVKFNIEEMGPFSGTLNIGPSHIHSITFENISAPYDSFGNGKILRIVREGQETLALKIKSINIYRSKDLKQISGKIEAIS